MITQTKPQDSACTRDLHASVNELRKIAAMSTISTPSNNKEVFLHLATLEEHIERISRRVDGEQAEMLGLLEGFAIVVSALATPTTDPKTRKFIDSYAKNLADEIANFRARHS